MNTALCFAQAEIADYHEFWLNLQAHYDLVRAREALGTRLAGIQPLKTAA